LFDDTRQQRVYNWLLALAGNTRRSVRREFQKEVKGTCK
jgi:hypothetical protein